MFPINGRLVDSFRERSARQIFAVLVGGYLRSDPTVHGSVVLFCGRRKEIVANRTSRYLFVNAAEPDGIDAPDCCTVYGKDIWLD